MPTTAFTTKLLKKNGGRAAPLRFQIFWLITRAWYECCFRTHSISTEQTLKWREQEHMHISVGVCVYVPHHPWASLCQCPTDYGREIEQWAWSKGISFTCYFCYFSSSKSAPVHWPGGRTKSAWGSGQGTAPRSHHLIKHEEKEMKESGASQGSHFLTWQACGQAEYKT